MLAFQLLPRYLPETYMTAAFRQNNFTRGEALWSHREKNI
jgi:hypothetical protein